MLTPDEVVSTARDLFSRHRDELATHDRVYNYVRGRYGIPDVPDGAGDELQDIARMSVKNVLSLVRDAFSQNLSVIGFRSPEATENDDVWDLWQANRLDARQAEAHRSAITYGTAYAVVGDTLRIRSPRQLFAVYADPQVDEWPVYALETWIDYTEKKPLRRGILRDDEFEYHVTLGHVTRIQGEATDSVSRRLTVTPAVDDDGNDIQPAPHGAMVDGEPVCPVVRFINSRDAEDMVSGEIEPLIGLQKAINAVNFDRLVVSRFGAFPQRYAIGWAASSKDELVKASMARLMAFDDEEIKVGSFPAASVDPYNSILEEMLTHVAMTAQIPISAFGKMANLSADALAMAEAPHQRKLIDKRGSFGESWEQMLRLLGDLNGLKVDAAAEVVWRDTEARAYGAVVDGITKLTASGVPIEVQLDDIPGWSQQRAKAARERIAAQTNPFDSLAATLDEQSSIVTDPADMKAKADAMGILIRAGASPETAAAQVGLAGLEFTGAVPVSLRMPEAEAAALEDQ